MNNEQYGLTVANLPSRQNVSILSLSNFIVPMRNEANAGVYVTSHVPQNVA